MWESWQRVTTAVFPVSKSGRMPLTTSKSQIIQIKEKLVLGWGGRKGKEGNGGDLSWREAGCIYTWCGGCSHAWTLPTGGIQRPLCCIRHQWHMVGGANLQIGAHLELQGLCQGSTCSANRFGLSSFPSQCHFTYSTQFPQLHFQLHFTLKRFVWHIK